MYDETGTYIRPDRKGKCFKLQRGIKQGDPQSSNLINSVLEHVFQKMNWEGKGIKINIEYLNNLRFVYDIVLISRDIDELKEMTNKLREEC